MKVVLTGCLCENDEHKKQITDAFKEEFDVDVKVLGAYATLPGHGGEGGRSDVVVEIPDSIIPKAAIHPWHLSGMFRWYDDYLDSSRDIVPLEALKKFFGEEPAKPECELTGVDGNVFALAGKVSQTLKRAGLRDKASEFVEKLPQCESYDEALILMQDYVEVV